MPSQAQQGRDSGARVRHCPWLHPPALAAVPAARCTVRCTHASTTLRNRKCYKPKMCLGYVDTQRACAHCGQRPCHGGACLLVASPSADTVTTRQQLFDIKGKFRKRRETGAEVFCRKAGGEAMGGSVHALLLLEPHLPHPAHPARVLQSWLPSCCLKFRCNQNTERCCRSHSDT